MVVWHSDEEDRSQQSQCRKVAPGCRERPREPIALKVDLSDVDGGIANTCRPCLREAA